MKENTTQPIIRLTEYKEEKKHLESPEYADEQFDRIDIEAAFRAAMNVKKEGVDARFTESYDTVALEQVRKYMAEHPLPPESIEDELFSGKKWKESERFVN